MAPRDKEVYFAKLAEQAERYDEMAEHMSLGQSYHSGFCIFTGACRVSALGLDLGRCMLRQRERERESETEREREREKDRGGRGRSNMEELLGCHLL